MIYVVAFHGMPLEKQIETFININEKQTKVAPSLLWDLYPTILEMDDIRYRISSIAKKLNEDQNSSLYGIIAYDSATYSDAKPKLSLESVCTALKSGKIVEDVAAFSSLLRIPNHEDVCRLLLSAWFQVIKEESKEHWNREDKTLNLFRSNQGVGALIKVFDEVLKEMHKHGKLDCLKDKDYNSVKKEFKEYLNPVF